MDPLNPIFPAEEQKDGGVVDPMQRTITITKEGVTVIAQHWSKTRLNRKYTTVDMRSPFYYLDTWEQSNQNEAFHVTIKNDNKTKVVILFKECIMEDAREYVYRPVPRIDDYEYKFRMKNMMDLRTKRGLEAARQILLSEILKPRNEVLGGQTRSGFIAYTTPSTKAEQVWLTVVMEKEPEAATASYERLSFKFDFVQDLVLFKRQPAVRR